MVLEARQGVPEKWSTWGNVKDELLLGRHEYIMELREAVFERITVANFPAGDINMYDITNCGVTKTSALNSLLNALRKIIPYYYKLNSLDDFDYENPLSFWTLEDMYAEDGCDISEDFKENVLISDSDYVKKIKAMRNVINKLRYTNIMSPTIICYTGYGDVHDPPFYDSVKDSILEANGRISKKTIAYFPLSVFAWSGNVHYKQVEKEDKYGNVVKEDGYCGYAKIQCLQLINFLNRLPGRDCKVWIFYNTEKPDVNKLDYADEEMEEEKKVLEVPKISFNNVELKKGKSRFDFTVKSGENINVNIGDVNNKTIPANKLVPVSDFYDGHEVRRGTITGYESRFFAILDYGITGGFRFFDMD
jgi:hypothetical protein